MAYEQLRLANQGCFRLYTAARLITNSYQPCLSKMGITYTQYLVLMVLWEHDHQPVNDIARRLLLETNTVTPLIKRMEALKIVSRRKDKDDARRIIVSLTERGRAMEKEAAEIPDCMEDIFCGKEVDVEALSSIFPVLDDFIAKMSKIEE
jgi:DNA-binding MarR family transcriptional regulator